MLNQRQRTWQRVILLIVLGYEGLGGLAGGGLLVAKPDMYVAWRASTADRFSLPTPLTDLNTAADERDPWLSPDGTLFYFTSDRGNGVLQIYEATASRRLP